MKKITFTIIALHLTLLVLSQSGAPANPYYNGFNWTLTGTALKNALANKITTTHTKFLTYSEDWNASQATDLNPTNSNNVLLLYGFSSNTCPSSTTDDNDHRERNLNSNGGANTCEWNREHVYAKSLGTPALIDGALTSADSDAGEDAHHIRSADVDRNANRGNSKFAAGTGNSGNVTGGWYPGDEWKGDVARMMMYMYLRYGSQCLPINVGTGATVASDSNMLQLFLQWNADDPVSQYEDNRNTYHGNTANTYAQGNRNPFIDNPYLATLIWGGPIAQDRWGFLSAQNFLNSEMVNLYPNPSNDGLVTIETTETILSIKLLNISGQIIREIENPLFTNTIFQIDNLKQGFYLVELKNNKGRLTKKIVVN